MNYDQVLIRFGDLMLKGKNRNTFINQVVRLIRQNIKDLNVEMIKTHDRVYLTINDTSKDLIIERLMRVSGIGSFSFVKTCSYELNDIVETAVTLLNKELDEETTFKVETKRADKTFPYTSQDFSKVISKEILPKLNHKVVVDLHHPKATLKIEIRENQVYLYLKSYKGLGGFPVGVAGNGVLMLSGGIDSPVAGFLAMKQGVQLEGIHFESTPLTSIESAQKVIDIAKKLALYSPKHEFNVLMVPFTKLHQAILLHVPESYIITVMRRMMFRIAEKLALKRDALAIVTGESIGQVASQTLNSMKTI
ncbi:MAG: tRNA uracil 4-sulfurtransferase ThiI, partial [Acholeplasmatales bacterium]|nr:tRNA uracil 4-sulfurtransferase ThiI [Acholeplasmatales bacterium]